MLSIGLELLTCVSEMTTHTVLSHVLTYALYMTVYTSGLRHHVAHPFHFDSLHRCSPM